MDRIRDTVTATFIGIQSSSFLVRERGIKIAVGMAQSFDESRIRSSKPQEDLVEDLQKENVLAFEY